MFWKRGITNKKGVEMEIGHIILAVLLLVILTFAVIFLLNGKGASLLDSIKNLMRTGRS